VTIDLVDHHRPDHFRWHITSSGMDVRGDEHLTDQGDGTLVQWAWDFAARRPLRRLGPLVGPAGAQAREQGMADMKRTLESASTSSTAPLTPTV
jgi:hypothetical protein